MFGLFEEMLENFGHVFAVNRHQALIWAGRVFRLQGDGEFAIADQALEFGLGADFLVLRHAANVELLIAFEQQQRDLAAALQLHRKAARLFEIAANQHGDCGGFSH